MGLRPAKCYTSLKDRAYTRFALRKPKLNYIGTNPAIRTRQWNMGNGVYNFSHIIDLIVKTDGIIRDNALEAARILVTSSLTKKIRKDGFFIKLRCYPFHILRENKQAQGAGADRVSTGMSHSFGKVIGRAVRVKAGKTILSVLVDEQHLEIAKACIKKAHAKIPMPIKLKVHTDVESIGTKPKKIKTMKEKKKEKTTEEEKEEEKTAKDTETGKEEKKGDKKPEAKSKK